MWKYIETGATGREGKAIARDHFSIRDQGCPVVELEPHGLFAVWCAAPLKEAKAYPLLHHKPAEESSLYDYERGA